MRSSTRVVLPLLAIVVSAVPSRAAEQKVALRYDVQVAGKNVPNPFVDVIIQGEKVLAIVDTGAGTHAMAGWLANKLKLARHAAPGAFGDITGSSAKVDYANAAIEVGALGKFDLGDTVVIDLPPPMEASRIGFILSPQLLAKSGQAIVLDLPGATMSITDEKSAFARPAGASMANTWARACGDAANPLANVTFAIPVSIEGNPATLTIDTGGSTTKVFAADAAGVALAARAKPRTDKGMGAAGAFDANELAEVTVKAGAVGKKITLQFIPGKIEGECPVSGVLGMDLLKPCVVAVSSHRVAVGCAK